jgi:hypothetical protein
VVRFVRMGWTAAARREAQSFDRIAVGYDRLGDLGGRTGVVLQGGTVDQC